MELFIIGISSYLMGSIPFGLILTKIFLKKDIREIGSGNIGATNALRTGNKLIGYSTLILDVLKAVIPVLYVKINFPDAVYISALIAFIGHVFPIWLKFKGGKGVATILGGLIGINLSIGILIGSIWLFVIFIFKKSSLSSLLSISCLPIVIFIFYGFYELIFSILLFGIICFRHKDNIKRLLTSEEPNVFGK